MKKTKESYDYLTLLESIPQKQWNKLEKFIASGYSGKRINPVLSLLKMIRQIVKKKKFNKKDLEAELFKKQTLEKSSVLSYRSHLKNAIEAYIIHDYLLEKELLKEHTFFEACFLKKIDVKLLRRKLLKGKEKYKNAHWRDDEYHDWYMTEYYLSVFNPNSPEKYKNTQDALDALYVSRKITLINQTLEPTIKLGFSSTYNPDKEVELMKNSFEHLTYLPPVRMGFQLYDLLKSQKKGEANIALWLEILKQLELYQANFSSISLYNYYTSMSNFGIRLPTTSKELDLNELRIIEKKTLEIYKKMDELDILQVGGLLDANKFRNAFALSLRCEDFNWTTKLKHKYLPQVAWKNKNKGVNYINALEKFHLDKK